MKAILDCNIWISFLIGHQAEWMGRFLTDTRFEVYVCDELLNEIHDVCSRPKIRSRINDEELEDFFRIIYAFCHVAKIESEAQSDIRDPKDCIYFRWPKQWQLTTLFQVMPTCSLCSSTKLPV